MFFSSALSCPSSSHLFEHVRCSTFLMLLQIDVKLVLKKQFISPDIKVPINSTALNYLGCTHQHARARMDAHTLILEQLSATYYVLQSSTVCITIQYSL